jgi:hypothetical protein
VHPKYRKASARGKTAIALKSQLPSPVAEMSQKPHRHANDSAGAKSGPEEFRRQQVVNAWSDNHPASCT